MKISFEIDTRLVVVTSLAGFAGLFALHGAYPSLHGFWPSSSQDLAAWVQAVGSVAAIVGSVWVAYFQLHKQAEKERRDAVEQGIRRVQLFYRVLLNAHRTCLKISSVSAADSQISTPTAILMRIEISGVLTRLSQLEVREFAESERLLEALSLAVSVAQALVTELDGYILGMKSGTASVGSLRTTAGIVTGHLDTCAKAVAEVLGLAPHGG